MASVLAEYVTYSGIVLELHIADASAQSTFERAFSVSRYRATFDVLGPLLVGLDCRVHPSMLPRAAAMENIEIIRRIAWCHPRLVSNGYDPSTFDFKSIHLIFQHSPK
jgi:putative component of membrane protein insertase Oxa1/YidC/SpoIIIJ protein YidD